MDCCVDVSLTTNVLECISAWMLGYRVMMVGSVKRLNWLFLFSHFFCIPLLQFDIFSTFPCYIVNRYNSSLNQSNRLNDAQVWSFYESVAAETRGSVAAVMWWITAMSTCVHRSGCETSHSKTVIHKHCVWLEKNRQNTERSQWCLGSVSYITCFFSPISFFSYIDMRLPTS